MISIPLNGETWIICGGRAFSDRGMFDDAMSDIMQLRGCPSRIVQGGAGGADRLAWDWATRMSVPCVEVYADWDLHGKAAGPIRNLKMLGYAPKAVVAFPGGRGTADMVAQARKAGVDVIEVQSRALKNGMVSALSTSPDGEQKGADKAQERGGKPNE